jgi:hypothetical protein
MEEEKTNLKSIEKDLLLGLSNAESKNADSANHSTHSIPDKLKLNVPNTVIKLVCDLKNSIATKVITKDMDESAQEFVRDYLKTTPREIELYKMVLEQVGTDFAPESYKEMLNKWLCNPIVLLIEHELEKLLTLRNLLIEMDKSKKTKKEVA